MRAFMILLGALAPAVALGEEPEPKAVGPAEKPWRSNLPPLPEIEPITSAQIEASLRRGADFLISSQNKNGSWGSATMTKGLNITAPIPGAHHAFRAGSTGLALEGLLRSGDRRPESVAAIEKAEAWFLKELPRLRRGTVDTMYNIWGHSYGIKALAELYRYREGDEAKRSALKNLAQTQVQRLQRYEDVNGGWGYYDFDEATQKPTGIPTSFTTATVMMALHKGRDVMNLELPPKEVKRGIAFLQRQQTPDFAYVYSNGHRYRPRYSINRPGGSLCRSPACKCGPSGLGRSRSHRRNCQSLARPAHPAQWLGRHCPQTTPSPLNALRQFRLLLLLWALLCHGLRRPAATNRQVCLLSALREDHPFQAREEWLLVGLSSLPVSLCLRNRLCVMRSF